MSNQEALANEYVHSLVSNIFWNLNVSHGSPLQDQSSAVDDGNPVMILSPTREALYFSDGDHGNASAPVITNPFVQVVANPDLMKNELPVMSTFRPNEVWHISM